MTMKTKTIEKTVKSIIYEANDGTEFQTPEECKQYENTAVCVLLTRYNKLVLKSLMESDIFTAGNDDYIVDIIEMKSTEDLNLVLQLYKLINSNSSARDNLIMESFENGDKLCIGRGYSGEEDCFWPISTEQHIIQRVKNCFNTENNCDEK